MAVFFKNVLVYQKIFCKIKSILKSDSFGIFIRSWCFLNLSLIFIMKPSFIDIISDTTIELSDSSYNMATRHACFKLIFALTTPTIVFDIKA